MDKYTKKLIESATNRANLSFLGVLIPIIGIGFGISAFSLTGMIPDSEETDDIVAQIKYRAYWGIILSVAVAVIGGIIYFSHVQSEQNKAVEATEQLQQQIIDTLD